jgi:hypothetical protein
MAKAEGAPPQQIWRLLENVPSVLVKYNVGPVPPARTGKVERLLFVQDGLRHAHAGMFFTRLPQDVHVLTHHEDKICRVKPMSSLFVSFETTDPYHVLIDAPAHVVELV